ncbi:MAG: hypothetical protein J6W60_06225, partial [Treponema sp.]|nr:hypothetical protein [Treponema sp.]
AEMAHNMLSQDKARFYREIRRAHEDGTSISVRNNESKGVEELSPSDMLKRILLSLSMSSGVNELTAAVCE